MDDTNKSPEAAPKAFGAADGAKEIGEPTELEILAGGVEIDIRKIDQTAEKVKVLVLPFSRLAEYGQLTLERDEAGLAELLCDKFDRKGRWNLENARTVETRLVTMMQGATFEQLDKIEPRLKKIRDEIENLEAKPRWADTLTEQSLIDVLQLGERLNAKRHGRSVGRRQAATGRMISQVQFTPSDKEKSPPQSQ